MDVWQEHRLRQQAEHRMIKEWSEAGPEERALMWPLMSSNLKEAIRAGWPEVAAQVNGSPFGPVPEPDEAEEYEESGWAPVRLTGAEPAPPPSVGEYAPGKHLFTRGVVSLVFGAGVSGKTSLLYLFAAQEVRKGNAVLILDYEMNPVQALDRLHSMGLTDPEIDAGIIYRNPVVSPKPEWLSRLRDEVDRLNRPLTFAVIDSLTESATMEGLDENSTGDMTRWFRSSVRWIPETWPTCASVVIDHLPKEKADAVFPIGSQRKQSACHMLLSVRMVEEMSRERDGHSVLTVRRSRDGYLTKGEQIARLDGGPSVEGFKIGPPSLSDAQQAARALMREHITEYLSENPRQSMRAIRKAVPGNNTAIANEVAAMVDDGLLTKEDGPRGAHLYSINKEAIDLDFE